MSVVLVADDQVLPPADEGRRERCGTSCIQCEAVPRVGSWSSSRQVDTRRIA
jgi:hypothetical protein